MKIICYDCTRAFEWNTVMSRCACGGLLQIEHDFSGLDADALKRLFHERLAERTTPLAGGVWRYKELIHPLLPMDQIVTKYEGNTGLYASEPVSRFTGARKLWLKAQSENPSGSFKDNGMAVAVSHGRSLGMNRFACSSTGNTSASLAMYAALCGGESYVFVPSEGVAGSKVLQTLAYGGRLVRFTGTYDDGLQFLETHAEALGLYVCNSVNPFRIEGQKSIIFEIAQMMDWSLPDWIVLPGGALSNASALGKGLRELKAIGLIERVPRVAIVQADGASPFHRMIAQGAASLTAEKHPSTRASALNIGNPPSWKKAVGTLHFTDGVTVSVSDEEIFAAKSVVDRSGIGCEPASAAAVAGLKKLVANGSIDQEETAVCILRGTCSRIRRRYKGMYRLRLMRSKETGSRFTPHFWYK
ncbi:threonine synthase [Paenibacillus cremeus]|uniref:Threonine synthase n=1 Tax=Paenibacillus cremeus TaxID=2163881 RepID=A0A559K054_9BACL|nr:threonine synthase [Paenibacillus cremeus]